MRPGLATRFLTLVLSIGITALAPSIVAAQTGAPGGTTAPLTPEIPSYARAIQGQNVWITADGARVRGLVTSIGPTSLVLVEDGVPTTIPYKNIVRVEKSSRRLKNGALIGLASGAGLGVSYAVAYCSDSRCYSEDFFGLTALTGFYAGLGAAAGVGVGAIVNAANKGGDVVYDSRRSTTTISFAPILSRTQKGVAFSMTWR